MGSSSGSQNTQTSQNTVSNPWQPTQPLLQSIVSQLGGLNTGVTNNQANTAQGVINSAGTAQNAISPILSSSLDPMSNPYLGPTISNTIDQTLGNINGQFAAAGRDLSPANSKAAAYGAGQAIDPLLLNQYNTNVSNLLSSISPYLGGAETAQTGANVQQGLPNQNIAGVLGNLLPIAGLGGQVSGTGTSNTQATKTPSVFSDILGGFGTLFPKGFQSA